MLHEGEATVATRISIDGTDQFEAALAVETRCLEVERFEHDLLAPPRLGLVLDPVHQPRAVALLAHRSGNEQVANVANPTPCPAIGAANDHPVCPV